MSWRLADQPAGQLTANKTANLAEALAGFLAAPGLDLDGGRTSDDGRDDERRAEVADHWQPAGRQAWPQLRPPRLEPPKRHREPARRLDGCIDIIMHHTNTRIIIIIIIIVPLPTTSAARVVAPNRFHAAWDATRARPVVVGSSPLAGLKVSQAGNYVPPPASPSSCAHGLDAR